MLVRLAIERDLDTIVELARLGAEESMRELGFNPERVRETFQKYLETANPTFFVVEQKWEVFGFLLASMSAYNFTDGFFTTQEVMFVRPDKRGTRAAALLVKTFVQWSDRLGALESTGGNDRKLFTEKTTRLLEHFGFENVGNFMLRRARSATHGKEGRRQ